MCTLWIIDKMAQCSVISVCTCHKETQDVGCQVNSEELRPSKHGKKLRRSKRKSSIGGPEKIIKAGKELLLDSVTCKMIEALFFYSL